MWQRSGRCSGQAKFYYDMVGLGEWERKRGTAGKSEWAGFSSSIFACALLNPCHNGIPTPPMQYEHDSHCPLPLHDPAAVDLRAFYPYTPNEVKHRRRTTSAQLKVLEAVFRVDTKPNANLRNDLAAQLSMTARGVQVCFFCCLPLIEPTIASQVWYQNRCS